MAERPSETRKQPFERMRWDGSLLSPSTTPWPLIFAGAGTFLLRLTEQVSISRSPTDKRRSRHICYVWDLSSELLGRLRDGFHVGLMIDDRVRDLSRKPFQLLTRRHELQVTFERRGNLGCRAACLCETLLCRQHTHTIGQIIELVNDASVSRKLLSPSLESNPQTADAA